MEGYYNPTALVKATRAVNGNESESKSLLVITWSITVLFVNRTKDAYSRKSHPDFGQMKA